MSSDEVQAQVASARARALAVEARDLDVMVVRGGDRQAWLNGIVTCDLAHLVVGGAAAYGLSVTQKGRILADLTILADTERLLVAAPRAQIETLRGSFDKYLIMEDAEVTVPAEGFAIVQLHGPKAGVVVAAARVAGVVGGAVDYTGLGGGALFVDRANEARDRRAIAAALAEVGGVVGDDGGWEALRLEQGVPRYGHDFDVSTYPQEAGLEKRAVSFSKGCYLGQEVVCMLEMRGHVKRKLHSLVLAAPAVVPKGASVRDASGAPIGEITSSALGPTLRASVALAMLKGVHAPGEELHVGDGAARIVTLPA